ncbi:MAG: hypothetical protein ACI4OC_06660, partial [Coriobacteriales bacterium]
PLQIKPLILMLADREIAKARTGQPCGMLFKTNSVTDIDIIEKIVQASQAGVPVTLFVRGICCLVPGVPGYTDNVRVLSIVGRLLEHSRIYGFGPREDMRIYLSSADLMTRNMDKRIEIAWPVLDERCKAKVLDYLDTCFSDNAKLRELLPSTRYTELGALAVPGEPRREAHELLIREALEARIVAAEQGASQRAAARHQAVIAAESREAELENLRTQEDAAPAAAAAEPAAAAVEAPAPCAAQAEAEDRSAAEAEAQRAAEAAARRAAAEEELRRAAQAASAAGEEARRKVAAAAHEAAAIGFEQAAIVEKHARAAAEKIPRDKIGSVARAVGKAAGTAARELSRSARALSNYVRRR